MKVLVIIPTYNEKENIRNITAAVLSQMPEIEILIVDDNSPDGTAAIVKEIQQTESRLHLLERSGKLGLGTAYIAGFHYALERDYTYVIEMDADFSHNPNDVPRLVAKAEQGNDLVVGSRYTKGGGVKNWAWNRELLSRCASIYTRIISGLPLHDTTAGFKCYHRKVLETINLNGIHAGGYSFQIEMKYKAWKAGFRLAEVPIIFEERAAGVSKMSKSIIYEAIFLVWKLRFSKP